MPSLQTRTLFLWRRLRGGEASDLRIPEAYISIDHGRRGLHWNDAESMESCLHLIAGMGTLAAAIGRLRRGRLPIEPDPELGHAANLLYMMTGKKPTPIEERAMDVALILHADHGMNASTFACLVVASTMSDIYFSVDAGIGALNGPLHGGANELVTKMLREIGSRGQCSIMVQEGAGVREEDPRFWPSSL